MVPVFFLTEETGGQGELSAKEKPGPDKSHRYYCPFHEEAVSQTKDSPFELKRKEANIFGVEDQNLELAF